MALIKNRREIINGQEKAEIESEIAIIKRDIANLKRTQEELEVRLKEKEARLLNLELEAGSTVAAQKKKVKLAVSIRSQDQYAIICSVQSTIAATTSNILPADPIVVAKKTKAKQNTAIEFDDAALAAIFNGPLRLENYFNDIVSMQLTAKIYSFVEDGIPLPTKVLQSLFKKRKLTTVTAISILKQIMGLIERTPWSERSHATLIEFLPGLNVLFTALVLGYERAIVNSVVFTDDLTQVFEQLSIPRFPVQEYSKMRYGSSCTYIGGLYDSEGLFYFWRVWDEFPTQPTQGGLWLIAMRTREPALAKLAVIIERGYADTDYIQFHGRSIYYSKQSPTGSVKINANQLWRNDVLLNDIHAEILEQ